MDILSEAKHFAVATRAQQYAAKLSLQWFFRLNTIPGRNCIVVKHPDSFERIVVQIFSHQLELLENIVRDRYHVASDQIRLKNIQELARAGPDELRHAHILQ